MRISLPTADRGDERGVTILLVVVAMFSILAMAVLAIDVVALYVTRAEAQRAADAGALAGAQALVYGGVTADPTNSTGIWTTACANAVQQAQIVASQNPVGGVTLSASQVVVTFPNAPSVTTCSGNAAVFGINPQVQVLVQRTDLPVFFARIWGVQANTVAATAVAEAFNPSNSASVSASGGTVPVAPRCVKPWMVPNLNPHGGGALFDPNTGAIQPGIIGQSISLQNSCQGKTPCLPAPPPVSIGGNVSYYPVYIPAGYNAYCPTTCSNGLTSNYAQSISCCYTLPTACGISNNGTVDLSMDRGNDTFNGVGCLIHAPGQDSLPVADPIQITAGSANPLVLAGAVSVNQYITSSNSVVTVPVYDSTVFPPSTTYPTVNVVGYLQIFVTNSDGSGNINGTILNVAGCVNANNGNAAVNAESTSPVPVRLITP